MFTLSFGTFTMIRHGHLTSYSMKTEKNKKHKYSNLTDSPCLTARVICSYIQLPCSHLMLLVILIDLCLYAKWFGCLFVCFLTLSLILCVFLCCFFSALLLFYYQSIFSTFKIHPVAIFTRSLQWNLLEGQGLEVNKMYQYNQTYKEKLQQ